MKRLRFVTATILPMLFTVPLFASSPDENRKIVEEFTSVVYNEHQLDRIAEFVSEEFVDRTPGAPEDAKGPEFVRKQAEQTFKTFPDLKFEILRTVAEGEMVAIHWRGVGTASLTKKVTTVYGISIFRMTDGKIIESWDIVDRLSMIQQLGYRIAPPN